MAAPPINQVEFTLNRINSTAAMSATAMVKGSIKEARPSCQVTAPINPRAAAFTPSSKAPAQADLRRWGIR